MSLHPLAIEGMKLGSRRPRSESAAEKDMKSPASVRAPLSNESSGSNLGRHELETGFAYFVSKQIALMPTPSPVSPENPLTDTQAVPATGGFVVYDSQEVKGVRWYHVTAINRDHRIIGDGWISCSDLVGQDLDRIDAMDLVTAEQEVEPRRKRQPGGFQSALTSKSRNRSGATAPPRKRSRAMITHSNSTYRELDRELTRLEGHVRGQMKRKGLMRESWQPGYDLSQRRAAAYTTLMSQGYSSENARETVVAMEENGLLPDPPRQ